MTAVFGISFSPLSQAELVTRLVDDPVPPGTGPRVLVTTNLDHVVQLQHHRGFRAAYDRAWTATADGMPIFLYAKLRGGGAPGRVTGAGLFADLMRRLAPERHRCFFLASSEETAAALADHLLARGFPASAVDHVTPPFGFETDAAYSERLAARIDEHGPTHLFLGVGAPKSEIWVHRHRDRLGDCYVLPVGAGLDFFVGRRRRAPEWVQATGFEWLWRFAQEPRRMFRRYFVDSWTFLHAIRRDLAERPLGRPRKAARHARHQRFGTLERVRVRRLPLQARKAPARHDPR